MATQRICSVEGCGKPHQARGFCGTHDYRMKKHGALEVPAHIKSFCSAPDCGRFVVANGLCDRHYRRLKAHGQLDLPPRVSKRPKCATPGCDKTVHGLGLCRPHYQRKKQLEREISTARHGEGMAFLEGILAAETDDCILWPFGSSRGYGVTYIAPKNVFAHRYVCERKHGGAPFTEAQAAHICGQRKCVNWRHLRWATAKENTHDKYIHGTMPMGEHVGLSKLDAEKVAYIRASAEGTVALGRKFGVDRNTIHNVRKRKTWRHLP